MICEECGQSQDDPQYSYHEAWCSKSPAKKRIRVLRVLEHTFDSVEQYHRSRSRWVQGSVNWGHEQISASIVSETLMGDDSGDRRRIPDSLTSDDGEAD